MTPRRDQDLWGFEDFATRGMVVVVRGQSRVPLEANRQEVLVRTTVPSFARFFWKPGVFYA